MLSRYVRTALGVASAIVTVMSMAPQAQAYEAKHTPSGALVHWGSTNVEFVVDPELQDAADGAEDAVTRALAAWDGVANAPSMTSHVGSESVKVGYDGVNSIVYAPDGYEPAGGALAITLVTYDDKTGVILDADIVLNGKYSYALLDDSARAPAGAAHVSTEGGGHIGGHAQFDLVHVLAHEAGHALGLSDEPSDATALMYPYTLPGDASSRLPAADDLAGVAVLYATPVTPAADTSSPDPLAGCSIARAPHAGGTAPFLLAAGLIAFPLIRRRSRRAAIARAHFVARD